MKENEKQELEKLIEQAQAGDQRAFQALLRHFEGGLLHFLYAMTNSYADAQDAFQETSLRMHGALASYREEGSFKAWLYAIARNEGLKQLRRQRRGSFLKQAFVRSMSLLTRSQEQPDQQLLAGERSRELEAAIAALPEKEREVVCLRLESELSFREIADVLDRPLNTVLSQMHRATARLQTEGRQSV